MENKRIAVGNDTGEIEIDIGRLLKAVWKNAWAIILAALLLGSITYLGTKLFIKPTYNSYFTAYINNKADSESTSVTNSDLQASQSLATTYAALLVSQPLLEDSAEAVGLDLTYAELQEAVTVSTVDDTEIIQVDVVLEDAEDTKLLADAIADAAPDYVSKIIEGSSMQIIAPAQLASLPYGPSYLKNTLIGFVLGALIAAAVVIIRDITDDRVKHESELEQRYNIPVMGRIPDLVEAQKKDVAAYQYK